MKTEYLEPQTMRNGKFLIRYFKKLNQGGIYSELTSQFITQIRYLEDSNEIVIDDRTGLSEDLIDSIVNFVAKAHER